MNTLLIKRKTTTLLLVCIVISNMAFACNREDATRKLAKAEDTIATAELNIAKFVAEAKASRLLSESNVATIKPTLLAINSANAKAIQITKAMLVSDTPENQRDLLGVINELSALLVKLNNDGLLMIKNPDKRAIFSALVVALQGAVSSAIVVVSTIKR